MSSRISRVFAIYVLLLALSVFYIESASAESHWPSQNEFAALKKPERLALISDLLRVMAVVEKSGLTHARNRYCVRGGRVWETSLSRTCIDPKTSCMESTVACSARFSKRACLSKNEIKNTSTEACASTLADADIDESWSLAEWAEYGRLVNSFCAENKEGHTLCSRKFISPIEKRAGQKPDAEILLRHNDAETPISNILKLIIPTALATEPCQFDEDKQMMLMPDGRKIFFDFGLHNSGEDQDFVLANVMNPDHTIRDSDRAFLQSRQNWFAQLRKRADRITRLAASEKIQWLGVEASPEEWGARYKESDFETEMSAVRTLSAQYGYSSEEQDEMTMLAAAGFGGGLRAYDASPLVRKNTRIVPFENQQAREKYRSMLGEKFRKNDYLFSLLAGHGVGRDEALRINSLYNTVLKRLGHVTDEELRTMSEPFGKNQDAVFSYLAATRQISLALIVRDSATTQNILAQSGNGVISIGLMHKATLLDRLGSACLKLQAASNGRSIGMPAKGIH